MGAQTTPNLMELDSSAPSVDDTVLVSDDPTREWYVLHTKSRREKRLAQRCVQLGIRHYLPLRKSITGRRGRRHIADVPLFPGYFFSCLNRLERWSLLRTGHIANVLEVVNQDGLLKDLRNIETAVHRGAFLQPSSIVKKSQRVRIVDGPFFGLEGVIKRHMGRHRLVLALDCIQQAVACEIDIRMVAPV